MPINIKLDYIKLPIPKYKVEKTKKKKRK